MILSKFLYLILIFFLTTFLILTVDLFNIFLSLSLSFNDAFLILIKTIEYKNQAIGSADIISMSETIIFYSILISFSFFWIFFVIFSRFFNFSDFLKKIITLLIIMCFSLNLVIYYNVTPSYSLLSFYSVFINPIKTNFNNIEISNSEINPWWLTGLADGDSSFTFSIIKDKRFKTDKWYLRVCFNIVASNNPANALMLNMIKIYFGNIGNITIKNRDNTLHYNVTSLNDCLIIKNHFMNYPLFTYKLVHFQLWCNVLELMVNNEHLTREGLLKIIALKEHLPKGLNASLKQNFPEYKPITNFAYNPDLILINIHWILGFINSDGNFSLNLTKSIKSTLGKNIIPLVRISQNNISLIVLTKIAEFLGFGNIYKDKRNNSSEYKFSKLNDINNFISLVKKENAKLWGAKSLDFNDFVQGIELMNNKLHLTKEGINKLQKISNNMNSKRTKF